MTNLEKIQALQAGELKRKWKMYWSQEGFGSTRLIPYLGDGVEGRARLDTLLGHDEQALIDDFNSFMEANAAKVEVTKGVLPVIEKALQFMQNQYVRDCGHSYPEGEEALTLLKTLQEALKQC
jgi:hypothetical protein